MPTVVALAAAEGGAASAAAAAVQWEVMSGAARCGGVVSGAPLGLSVRR